MTTPKPSAPRPPFVRVVDSDLYVGDVYVWDFAAHGRDATRVAAGAAARLSAAVEAEVARRCAAVVPPNARVIGPPRCLHGEMTIVPWAGLWARAECGCVAEYHYEWRAPDVEHARGLLAEAAEHERRRAARAAGAGAGGGDDGER